MSFDSVTRWKVTAIYIHTVLQRVGHVFSITTVGQFAWNVGPSPYRYWGSSNTANVRQYLLLAHLPNLKAKLHVCWWWTCDCMTWRGHHDVLRTIKAKTSCSRIDNTLSHKDCSNDLRRRALFRGSIDGELYLPPLRDGAVSQGVWPRITNAVSRRLASNIPRTDRPVLCLII